ncbi:MAG: ABC transporter substrate-binding protein, partial [Myxococcota bacterium]|nr:ABC transporter substrate-binding protein [Myxococcota bacterium]
STASDMQHVSRFVDDLRRIGIKLEVINNTWAQMLEKMDKGEFQVAGLAWGFDYPDAQNILQLLYGPNEAPGINSSNFKNAEFDALYDASAKMEDSPERTALYEKMAHIVADHVPWITRTHRIRPNLQHEWLQGFKYTEVHDGFWRYVGVDADLRKASVAAWNQPTRWPLAVLGLLLFGLLGATVARGRPR